MNLQESQKSAFPDFSKFGMGPATAGQLIDLSVIGDDGSVEGVFFQHPDGRIGGLTISNFNLPDDGETLELGLLVNRCSESAHTLDDLRSLTKTGTYAWSLIMDAVAAGVSA